MYVVNWSSRGPILDRISDFISDLKTPFNCGGKFFGWNILGIHQTPITNLSFSTSCWISLDVLESRLSVGVAVLIQLFSHREVLKKKTISPHGLLFPFLRLLNFHFRHDNNVFVLGLLSSVAGPVSSLLPVMLTSCLSDWRHLRSLPQHLLLHHWRHRWRHAPSQVSLRAGLNTNIHTYTFRCEPNTNKRPTNGSNDWVLLYYKATQPQRLTDWLTPEEMCTHFSVLYPMKRIIKLKLSI